MESGSEVIAFLQDREPREPGLVDFEYEALEQSAVVANREAVLGVMEGTVNWMAQRDSTVTHRCSCRISQLFIDFRHSRNANTQTICIARKAITDRNRNAENAKSEDGIR